MNTPFPSFTTTLEWIDSQRQPMVRLLRAWSAINSESNNLDGLEQMLEAIESRFAVLKGEMQRIALPSRLSISAIGEQISLSHGEALRITKRPDAPIQIFLGGHMDTVYAPAHPFQTVDDLDHNTLRGPGVADMKGGLIVLLTALEALEKEPCASNIGWEVLINPDEEIGSLGSEALLAAAAKRNQLGLIFEPSFADGALVSSRKGSANFTLCAGGRPAHAGRDFDKGRNAIVAIANFITRASALSDSGKGISVNIGQILGGGPVNVVPDQALCRLNMRAVKIEDFEKTQHQLKQIADTNPYADVTLKLYAQQARGPKPFDDKCQHLFHQLNLCAKEEGYELFHRPSGGVCDGNILAFHGLPVIDSLGVIGGEIHTPNEYMFIDSLVTRSRLVALFLLKMATGSL